MIGRVGETGTLRAARDGVDYRRADQGLQAVLQRLQMLTPVVVVRNLS